MYGNGNPLHVTPVPYNSMKHGKYCSVILDNGSIAPNATHILQTSHDSRMCSAARMDTSLSDVSFFPVPCNKPLKVQMLCQKTAIPKCNNKNSLKEDTEIYNLLAAYNIYSHALALSSRSCPPGYNIYWAKSNKYINIVYPRNTGDVFSMCDKQHPSYDRCKVSIWSTNITGRDSPHYQLERAMKKLCENDNTNATVLKETDASYLNCALDKFNALQYLFRTTLKSFYPDESSILHMVRSIPVRSHIRKIKHCDHCIFHSTVGKKWVTDPLVACAMEPITPSEHPIPEAYVPSFCSDGSLIAEGQACDGKPDCSDNEDEASCNHICSGPAESCIINCILPYCTWHDNYMCDVEDACTMTKYVMECQTA